MHLIILPIYEDNSFPAVVLVYPLPDYQLFYFWLEDKVYDSLIDIGESNGRRFSGVGQDLILRCM